MTQNILLISQIILSLTLAGLILIQSRGGGLSRSVYSQQSFTRRGLERIIFRATFVVAFLFILVSVFQFSL